MDARYTILALAVLLLVKFTVAEDPKIPVPVLEARSVSPLRLEPMTLQELHSVVSRQWSIIILQLITLVWKSLRPIHSKFIVLCCSTFGVFCIVSRLA